jgi:ParB family transcriptional regulator, chromosome partitioning protein
MDRHRLDLDLHRLDLRFAGSRLVEPQAVARIAQSIERCGQIVPCIVVAVPGGASTGSDPRVLIDGYRRVAALRRLGRDTAWVEQWTCDLTEALLGVLARTQDRRFASIEEALLLRELVQGQGLSQHDLARCSGRDVSWVSRRLALLSALPDAALAAVRAGKLSSWAANRIVVPLARANTEHADRLLAELAVAPLSTRELQCWFEHYEGPRDPCASAWSTIPVCFSTPGGRPMNDAPANDCALARKANALPICAASRRCSYA